MFRIVNFLRLIPVITVVFVSVGCNLGTPQATPVPTPDIPTVQILAPPNNAQVVEDTDFDIDILGVDQSQGIAKIELYVDGTLINDSTTTDTLPQYRVTMNWLAQGIGLHVVSAIAYRADEARSDETLINIEVVPRN